MAQNPKFLKNLLTTASALAIVSLSATSASAGALRATDGVGDFVIPLGTNLTGWANGDSLDILHAVNGATGGAAVIAGIDVGVPAGQTLDFGHATSLGSVKNTAGTIDVDISAAVTLELTGTAGLVHGGGAGVANVYSGLKDINLGNAAANLYINLTAPGAIDLLGTIENGGAGEGTINIAAGNTVNFKDTIGATNSIRSLTLKGNAAAVLEADTNFDGTVGAGGIVMGNGSVLTVNNGVTISGVDNGNDINIAGAAAGNGTLKFAQNATVNVESGIGTGANNALAAIEIGTGKVTMGATTTVIKATDIKFTANNAAAELELTAATTVTGAIKNTSGTNNVGTLTINGNDQVVIGSIGENTATGSIKAIKFATDDEIKIKGTDAKIYAADISRGAAGAAIGKVGLQGDTQTIYSNLGRVDAPLTEVNIYENTAGGGAAVITLDTNKKIYATTVDLAKANQANVLELKQDTLISGAVDTANAGQGRILIKGDTKITGKIGNTNEINNIAFHVDGAGRTITLDGDLVKTKGDGGVFDFTAADGIVKLTAVGNTAITSTRGVETRAVITGGASKGTITSAVTAGNTLTITGRIGDHAAADALKLLEVKGGGNINLASANAHITKIDMGDADAQLTLSTAGTVKIEDFAHADGKGTLEIAADIVVAQDTKFSVDAAHRLKQVLFNGDRQVTFNKATNIFATDGIINNGADRGKFIYLDGANVIGAQVGTDLQKFNTLSVRNANTSVELQKDAYFNGLIDIDDNATLIVGGNVLKANDIAGRGGANRGTVKFNNANPLTYTGTIGAGNKIKTVEIAGGDVTVTGAHTATTIKFSKAAQAATYKIAGDLAATNVETVSTTRNHNIKVTVNQVIGGNIGTANNPLGNIIMDAAGKTIDINTATFFAGVTSTKANDTEVTVSKGVDLRQLGDATNPLKLVTFAETGSVTGNTYSKKLEVADGKTETFKGVVSSADGLELKGANGANAIFNDGSELFASIITETADKSTATFNGNAVVGRNIGASDKRLLAVTFDGTTTPTGTQALGADIHSKTITFTKTNLVVFGDEVTLNGTSGGADNSINLLDDTLKFTGETTSNFTGATNILTTFNGTDIGHLTAEGTKTIVDFTAATAGGKVTLIDASEGSVQGTQTYKLVTPGTGTVKLNTTFDFEVPTDNIFVKWTSDKTAGTFTVTDNGANASKQILANAGATEEAQANSDAIFNATGGSAAALKSEWTSVGRRSQATLVEAEERFSSPLAQTSSEGVSQALESVMDNVVGARPQTFSNQAALRVTQADGVAAGAEDTLRYGAWGSPFYSQGVQKVRKGVSGYKSRTVGGTVGFDTMANDTMLVGIAATVAKTDLKHKNTNAGDKTKADTLMFSIYGVQEIANDWFLQGVANFGSTKVKNTAKRIGFANGGIANQTATAKYDSMSWGGEVMGGYNFNVSSMAVLTPMLGVDYMRINDSGYTETGTTSQNQIVSKKSIDKVRLVAGVRAVMADIEQSGFVITPEVHGFVRQELNNKKAKLDVKLDGATKPLVVKNVKPAKTMGNLGLGINASSGMMSYGLTYDAHLANKYVGHQGTFKVRVNF